jgi:hypothetical protein
MCGRGLEELDMRTLPLILLCGVAASCTMAPPPPQPMQAAQSGKAMRLLAGKVAGPPQDCISTINANDMTWLDHSTVAFKRGSNLVYVNHFNGGCDNYADRYALVTRQVTGQLCRGDIAQLVDPVAHYPVGSCNFGEFIPYRRP